MPDTAFCESEISPRTSLTLPRASPLRVGLWSAFPFACLYTQHSHTFRLRAWSVLFSLQSCGCYSLVVVVNHCVG